MVDASENRRGYCPQCHRSQNCNVVGHKHTRWEYDDEQIWGHDDYYMLQCRGCESIFFQHASIFSEDINSYDDTERAVKVLHWPPVPVRSEPDWLHEIAFRKIMPIYRRMADVYGALNAGLNVPAAGAMRTAFDVVAVHLGVDPNLPFVRKLDDLVKRGELSAKDREALDILVEAGSASLHRGWEPKEHELQMLAHILESFVERKLIITGSASRLSQSVPRKKSRDEN